MRKGLEQVIEYDSTVGLIARARLRGVENDGRMKKFVLVEEEIESKIMGKLLIVMNYQSFPSINKNKIRIQNYTIIPISNISEFYNYKPKSNKNSQYVVPNNL